MSSPSPKEPTVQVRRPKQSNLTKKQRTVVDTYLSDKNVTKQQAYLSGFNVRPGTTKASIAAQTTKTFNNPLVKMELAKHNSRVEQVLYNTMDEWGSEQNSRKREIAVDTAKYIHDKIHGRSKQQIEVQSTTVTIGIDLTQAEDDVELPDNQ